MGVAGAIAQGVGVAANIAGTLINAESQRKKDRQARIQQEEALQSAQERQRMALGKTDEMRNEIFKSVDLLKDPTFKGSDISRMTTAYSDSLFGGQNAALSSLRSSLAARGMTKSGMADDKMLNFYMNKANAEAQGINQILTNTAQINRSALEHYVNTANTANQNYLGAYNSALLGMEPSYQAYSQNLSNILSRNPWGTAIQGLGQQAAQLGGGVAGQMQGQTNFNSLMDQMKKGGGGGNQAAMGGMGAIGGAFPGGMGSGGLGMMGSGFGGF